MKRHNESGQMEGVALLVSGSLMGTGFSISSYQYTAVTKGSLYNGILFSCHGSIWYGH